MFLTLCAACLALVLPVQVFTMGMFGKRPVTHVEPSGCYAPTWQNVPIVRKAVKVSPSGRTIAMRSNGALNEQHAEVSSELGESNCLGPNLLAATSKPMKRANGLTLRSETMYNTSVARWRALEKKPAPPKSKVQKLAIMMLIYQRMVFPKAWEEFLMNAPDSFSLVIHAKLDKPELTPFFQKYLLNTKYSSNHCDSIWLTTNLLRKALADNDVTHLALVSGTSLPLRTIPQILTSLREDDRSRFCVDEEWTRAETWSVLRRDHAELIDDHRDEFQQLVLSRCLSCVDEESFHWALSERGEAVMDQCTTMTDWSGTPKSWGRVAQECECPAFLASVKTPASCLNPATLRVVTSEGMEQLLKSPQKHWFVRKFSGDASRGRTESRPKFRMNSVNRTKVLLDDVWANRFHRISQLPSAPRGLLEVAPGLP